MNHVKKAPDEFGAFFVIIICSLLGWREINQTEAVF